MPRTLNECIWEQILMLAEDGMDEGPTWAEPGLTHQDEIDSHVKYRISYSTVEDILVEAGGNFEDLVRDALVEWFSDRPQYDTSKAFIDDSE